VLGTLDRIQDNCSGFFALWTVMYGAGDAKRKCDSTVALSMIILTGSRTRKSSGQKSCDFC
jgi:hypothetical protein